MDYKGISKSLQVKILLLYRDQTCFSPYHCLKSTEGDVKNMRAESDVINIFQGTWGT